jgi:hypothetical protein
MFLEVLDELVLAAKLLVVPEVVHPLMRQQPLLVQLRYELLLTPNHVPLIALDTFPAAMFEGVQYAVGEIGAEANGGTG